MLRGRAEMVEPGAEQAAAVALLRDRYPPYKSMALDTSPMIALRVEKVTSWGMLSPAPTSPTNVTPKAG
jgi:hypothetical protein